MGKGKLNDLHGLAGLKMNDKQEKQLEEALQDNEYALAWAQADKDFCKVYRRLNCSPFKLFWKIYFARKSF
jgi:hypothetical protein